MQIGLYFGSFNPIHNGHLIIANHILNETDIQKIWFIVSPQNPFKQKGSLLNEYDRLHLVKKAVEDNPAFKASDVEFGLPRPSYTAKTLAFMKEKYPNHSFHIVMGSDSFRNLPQWKEADAIITRFPLLIYKRPGVEIVDNYGANLKVLQAPLLEISASHIRQLIHEGKSIKYLVPPCVEEEIVAARLFK